VALQLGAGVVEGLALEFLLAGALEAVAIGRGGVFPGDRLLVLAALPVLAELGLGLVVVERGPRQAARGPQP